MASYFQMGHDSENIVGTDGLDEFRGIILSPVNRTRSELISDIARFRDSSKYQSEFDIILDPQLYLPQSDRGELASHPHFPSDLDSTSELASPEWWRTVAVNVADYARDLKVNAVSSPILLPKLFTDEYYLLCSLSAVAMAERIAGTGIRPLLTLIVDLNEMAPSESAPRIASIVSEFNLDGYYLVVSSDVPPRREFLGENELAGVMHLIHLLEATGKPVTVSHSSSDVILAKAAGASNCATGKFFNLRRFSRSRYDEPSTGGKVIAYWFEQSLLSFLRAADVARLKNRSRDDLIGHGYSSNTWSQRITAQWEADPAKPWLALSWRHYLSWFGKMEASLSQSSSPINTVSDMLESADENWGSLSGILFDERENDGGWVRNWRQALNEFATRAGM